MPTQNEIVWAWNRLVRACDAKAAACADDPIAAALDGIAPEYEYADDQFLTFGGQGERQVRNDAAAWLRAVARLMIDQTVWNYRVYEAFGGMAYLALISFNGGDDYDFGQADP